MPEKVSHIALNRVEPNPSQPRKTFPADYIARLAESINKRGLIQPITVRPDVKRLRRFTIVAGECRWRAHVLLKRKTIAAMIVSITDQEMALRAIVENLQRHEMNAMEEAFAFKALIDCGLTIQGVVDELGFKGQARVQNRLNLLELVPEIQSLVASGNLSASMASAISLSPQPHQLRIARQIGNGMLRTVEQVHHASIALRDAALQTDAFGDMPKASRADIASINRLEEKITAIANMVAAGFKEGECIIAQRIAPDRVKTIADKLLLIRRHILQMEHDLRRVATQAEIRLEPAE